MLLKIGDFMNTLAFDIGGTAIKFGIVDDANNLIDFNEIPSNAKLGGNHIVEKITEIATNKQGEFDRIGISTAGQVDSEKGIILYANENIPNYTNTRLADILENKFNVPVCVENDVNCAAIGEAIYGAGKGFSNFLCLTYGTGIGGAIWLNNSLYKGSRLSAGEFGNIVTHANGRKCPCGNLGCYEVYGSTTALLKDIKDNLGIDLNGREAFSKEYFNDTKPIIDNWINEICLGLSSLIFIFNPSLIILGGGIMNEEYIISAINEIIHSKEMHSFKSVEIRKAKLGNKAGLFGSAYLSRNIK